MVKTLLLEIKGCFCVGVLIKRALYCYYLGSILQPPDSWKPLRALRPLVGSGFPGYGNWDFGEEQLGFLCSRSWLRGATTLKTRAAQEVVSVLVITQRLQSSSCFTCIF